MPSRSTSCGAGISTDLSWRRRRAPTATVAACSAPATPCSAPATPRSAPQHLAAPQQQLNSCRTRLQLCHVSFRPAWVRLKLAAPRGVHPHSREQPVCSPPGWQELSVRVRLEWDGMLLRTAPRSRHPVVGAPTSSSTRGRHTPGMHAPGLHTNHACVPAPAPCEPPPDCRL